MINVIKNFNELFAFMEMEKHWFSMLAFVYVRVGAQAGSSSLGAQRQSLLSYAEGLGLKHAFVMEVRGGARQAGKKQLQEMVDFYEKKVKAGSCPVLVVEKFDRLSRDLQDTTTICDLVYRKSLQVHLVEESRVFSAQSMPSDFLMYDRMFAPQLLGSFYQGGE